MNLKLRSLVAACSLACASTSAFAGALPESQLDNDWYQLGEQLVEQKTLQSRNTNTAKNVILFVGDGMGISTLTAARILEGQLNGDTGEEHFLSFEKFPHTALVKTYNTDQQTPDSAGTMTAMMTGVKNRAGVISLGPMAVRGECGEDVEGNKLTSALTLAERKGKATGIISTARITHATPAATYSTSPDRNWEDDTKLPEDSTCTDIASQLINYSEGNGIEVAMGGGRRHFQSIENGGRRKDSDLTEQWLNDAGNETRSFVTNKTELENVDLANTDKLLGLFTSSHMSYEADRDDAEEPSLAEMTETALEVLKKDEDGFFLMVEGGRIDHGHHAGNAYRALTDAHAFAKAVQTALDNTSREDTLIIVTADHSHVFTIAGYPKRGNPILGKVVNVDDTEATDLDGLPYTTVGYMNGLGFADLATGGDTRYNTDETPIATGRVDLTNINTEGQGFHQEALVPLGSETHAGEDISVHAIGPGSHLFGGVIEQNEVFHVINEAADLGGKSY